ncbi:uncharacterized protein LOC144706856 [Wolffia australiana]
MGARGMVVVVILLGVAAAMGGGVAAVAPKYKDSRQPLMVRVRDLMKRMTLAEKIGQMTQIERSVASPDVVKKYHTGSVLSGGGSVPKQRASPNDWATMVNALQQAALSTRLAIPIIYGIDAVHGHNNVFNATIFPHNIGLGVTRDPSLAKRIGAATALEVRATGIHYTFAPCIAVCRDPRWGRCYESYSEDPSIVVMMTEIIPGLQGDPPKSAMGVPFVGGQEKVAACAKHFVGDGGTLNGMNEDNTIVNFHDLLSIHMQAYYQAVIKGVSTIMVSYSSWNGRKMHSNSDLITGFLKNVLHFRGFVISDWQGIDRITFPPGENYTFSVKSSINAGLDMIMVPFEYQAFISNLTYLVEHNFVNMTRIDDAVERILRVKFAMGLFENPLSSLNLASQLGSQEHRELAREAARKSFVLLKNGKSPGDDVVPLPKKASRLLVAGTHADNLGYQCGGWTIEWMGVSGNNATAGTTILSGIRSAVDPSTEVVFSEAPDEGFIKAGKFTVAVVAVGETPYAESLGDRQNLTILEPGPSIVQQVCALVRCVVILVTGRPVVVEPLVPLVDALIAAWLPGSEGGTAMADVLFGDHGFSGKLARTWFRSVDQLPMNVGDPHYDPLFAFGFGLTTQAEPNNRLNSGGDIGGRGWWMAAMGLIITCLQILCF